MSTYPYFTACRPDPPAAMGRRPLDADCLAEAQFPEWDFRERMKKLLGG